MPTNRELLMNQRKKQKGLPAQTNKVITEPRNISAKVDIGKRETAAAFKRADRGLATKGIKDVDTAISREFSGLNPDLPVEAEKKTNTFQGKPITDDHVDTFQGQPIPENVGMPSNVTLMPKRVTSQATNRGVSSFGLPTDRLPSFSELGGAIGQMFKFVGGLTKKRQALGLIPGRVTNASAAKGLSLTAKDRATILAKQLDDLTLSPEERNRIKSELDKIMNPASAEERTDIDAILNE